MILGRCWLTGPLIFDVFICFTIVSVTIRGRTGHGTGVARAYRCDIFKSVSMIRSLQNGLQYWLYVDNCEKPEQDLVKVSEYSTV